MFQNYIKIAIRNLQKNKAYSFINIAGLAIGIACCLLIMLFVAHELSYDRWNPQADRIVRTYADINFGGNQFRLAVTGVPIGPETQRELPDVQSFCRFRDYGSHLVRKEGEGTQNFREEEVLYVDSTFFEVFPLAMASGEARTCLTQPNSIVLSRSKAEKHFGSAQAAMGQNLIVENESTWKVTGVFEDMPANSHFQAHLLMSLNGNKEILESPPLWAVSNNFHTYLLLKEGTSFDTFNEKFNNLSRQKIGQTAAQLLGLSLEQLEATGQYARIGLQRLTDIHLRSDLGVELGPNGDIQYVWIFSAIALFVLLIACINFMNLATARSAHRAKEIGVRKVLGSTRGALIGQFMSETLFMAFLSLILALALASAVMPWFNELTGRAIQIPWASPVFWGLLACGVLITGFLAGSYPSFFLSGFETIKVLKGQLGRKAKHGSLRSALVVFQFATAIVLIICTTVVYNQLNYIQNKKLGFQKDQLIILDDAYALGDGILAFKQEMLKHPGVESATISSFLPVPSSHNNTTYTSSREFRQDNSVNMDTWDVDHDYFKTLGLELKEGRLFDKNRPADSLAVIINETALKNFGFTENPIGKKIYYLENAPTADTKPGDFIEFTVIGVVKNFHYESLRTNINSLGIFLDDSRGLITVRYKAGESKSVIAALEKQWKAMAPTQPFSYRFLDEAFSRMYQTEQRLGQIALIFASLAIFVSCLGLFGLASFMAEQRTKEIGIRKVLGATTAGIVGLLSKDFLLLVGFALLIATPLAWWGMHKWLQDFVYRIDISAWVFVMAGLAAIAIAFITVGFQSIRAALANPVNSLRSE